MDSFVASDWNEGRSGLHQHHGSAETHRVTMDIQQYIEEHKKRQRVSSKVNFGLRSGPVDNLSGDTNELSVDGPNYVRPAVGGFLGATEATRRLAIENWLKKSTADRAGDFHHLRAHLPLTDGRGNPGFYAVDHAVRPIRTRRLLHFGGQLVRNLLAFPAGHPQHRHGTGCGLWHLHGLPSAPKRWDRRQLDGVAAQHAEHDGLRRCSSRLWCCWAASSRWSARIWPTPGDWGIYIGEALIIDVFTALMLLPLLVYWLKPAYVFGGGRG